MPTTRGISLLVAASVLWTVARSFGIEELQIAAVAAVALVVAAALLVWLGPTRLRLRRRLRPDRIHADDHALLSLEVANIGRLPTPPMTLRDARPGAPAAVTHLPLLIPHRSTTWTTAVPGTRRGRSSLGPAVIEVTDPFGLVTRRRVLPSSSELFVYPRVVTLPPGVALGGGTGVTGRPGSRPRPTSHDVADLREYVRGDDLRAIHWPSTAHRGKLMVRTAESPEDARAVVVLDRRTLRHAGTGADSSFETAVSATASVVRHLTDRGRAVALVDGPVAAAPDPAPWRHWLDQLAEVDTDDVDLSGLLRQVAQGVAGDGVIVAVMTPPLAEELPELVRAGRGFSTRIALLIDVASHGGPAGRARTADAAAAGLRAAGWRVVVVHRGDRLDERWQQLVLAPRAVAT